MENQNNLNLFEKLGSSIKNSVMLKLITITILMLLLLIPTAMIEDIISERSALQQKAVEEVSNKWAATQEINGPILVIPLKYENQIEGKVTEDIVYRYILPEELNINGTINPKKLKRGVFEVVVYDSDIAFEGSFDLNFDVDEINLKEILYSKAFLTIGFSDLRGIENNINFKWDNTQLNIIPGSKIPHLVKSGITIYPKEINEESNQVNFNFSVALQGSQNLSFVPVGSTTNVKLNSPWPSPSFNGNFLPKHRSLNENGFSAHWSVLELNRNYPQSWQEESLQSQLAASAFGVDLFNEVDDYKKSERSAKYAVMTITLTFLVFFLIEVVNKRKIHPFQYILVGLALCLFYVLLVSLSEHLDFNLAYGISTIGIVSMITLYALHIIRASKIVIVLMTTLIGIYGFVYVTLQMADYALLIGSIGLTLILALTMYLTRKIDWYNLQIKQEGKLSEAK